MRLTIKVKRINKSLPIPKMTKKGDWIDLRSSETVHLKAPQSGTLKRRTINGQEESYRNVTFDTKLINLGIAIQLPKGTEAIIVPRSSTYKNFGVLQSNHIGVVDYSYKGDNDEWKFPAVALMDTTIQEGDRICQFRVQLSQKATVWQKLKWLFSSGIKLIEVENLNNPDRNGIGTTGIK